MGWELKTASKSKPPLESGNGVALYGPFQPEHSPDVCEGD